MERLQFECPVTGQHIDVGIESEITSLLRIRSQMLRAQCQACGKWHEWQVGDAFLAKAA